ncbi:hypothetical protein [Allostreptomyces psammosilenae]|uniref:Uncharacterized protein n=1 Tax=Allostreptomyces psammosilenae TaxID=1892865 RepID=A0A853A7C8_9ACTN|nr:hypothetical protein [Allostreptomyces psammosilenae]NYI06352.1 hypothetical protein [Allostreptomyces psammosilenae]
MSHSAPHRPAAPAAPDRPAGPDRPRRTAGSLLLNLGTVVLLLLAMGWIAMLIDDPDGYGFPEDEPGEWLAPAFGVGCLFVAGGLLRTPSAVRRGARVLAGWAALLASYAVFAALVRLGYAWGGTDDGPNTAWLVPSLIVGGFAAFGGFFAPRPPVPEEALSLGSRLAFLYGAMAALGGAVALSTATRWMGWLPEEGARGTALFFGAVGAVLGIGVTLLVAGAVTRLAPGAGPRGAERGSPLGAGAVVLGLAVALGAYYTVIAQLGHVLDAGPVRIVAFVLTVVAGPLGWTLLGSRLRDRLAGLRRRRPVTGEGR